MNPDKKNRLKLFFTETLAGNAIFLGGVVLVLIDLLATADDRATQKALLAAQAEAEKAARFAQADCAFTYKGKDYRAAAAQPDQDWPSVRVLGPTFTKYAESDWSETNIDSIYAKFVEETDEINALRTAIAAIPACKP